MFEVLRLAVPPVEPGEDAEHLGGALRTENSVGASESSHVEVGLGGLTVPHISTEELELQIRRHRDARVLQEGGNVIGWMAEHGILKVEQSDPLETLPLRKPDQV